MLLIVAIGMAVGAGAAVAVRYRRAGLHGGLRQLDGAEEDAPGRGLT